MRPMFLLPLFLLACGGSGQSFSGGGDENNEVSDAGTLEVYPTNEMGIDFGSISVTSVGKMKGFRVSNIGEGTLIVTHVRITDAGENVGKEVFKDLRRADGGQGTNFTLSEGQKMEFTVNASGNTPMDAVGNIEIYTSDISVDIGGPASTRFRFASPSWTRTPTTPAHPRMMTRAAAPPTPGPRRRHRSRRTALSPPSVSRAVGLNAPARLG